MVWNWRSVWQMTEGDADVSLCHISSLYCWVSKNWEVVLEKWHQNLTLEALITATSSCCCMIHHDQWVTKAKPGIILCWKNLLLPGFHFKKKINSRSFLVIPQRFIMYTFRNNSMDWNLFSSVDFLTSQCVSDHSNERSWPSAKRRSSGRGTGCSGRGQRQRRQCFP